MKKTTRQIGPVISRNGLDRLGLDAPRLLQWNLPPAALIQQAVQQREGVLVSGGAFNATTGKHTGRSPNDKFFVDHASLRDGIDWGKVNRPIAADAAERIWAKARKHVGGRDLFVQDLLAGADPAYQIKVRVITEQAWHNLFARNMFRVPSAEERIDFQPDYTVLQVPSLEADPASDGTNSETAILVDLERKSVLVCGSSYAGEIKKSIFGVLNYLLPSSGVMPMHCSANVGPRGDTAIFFGLSGTGKTTLSADSSRMLLGDDEHGWGPNGVFNFEGGCYAKVIKLKRKTEPEIFDAVHRFGTILENVVVDPMTGAVDFDDGRLTENTRASYPLDFIPNASATGMAGHPKNIVMLTADAFGVLPPISRLTPEQAMYHFLSGYTAKVAGTEKGLAEPQATFSTCFGAPFMPRHPSVYAKMLGDLMRQHDVTCWLVNTGWTGGGYGVGERMKLGYTRAMVQAALDGKLSEVAVRPHPDFGLLMPEACPQVPCSVLSPRGAWSDSSAYDQTARDVAGRFADNFTQFEAYVSDDVKSASIQPRN
ncbi:MAG: phosphoenolpyruvate carboxykinase (ATP) [Geminicoccaceae bacterium]